MMQLDSNSSINAPLQASNNHSSSPFFPFMASTLLKFLLLLFSLSLSKCTTLSLNSSSSEEETYRTSAITVCKSTPYPDACYDSLKLSTSINTSSIILNSIQTALSQGLNISNILSNADGGNLIEKQRGAIQDCRDMHQVAHSSLQNSMSIITAGDSSQLDDAITFLSAALTNKNTCLEGLNLASGSMKQSLVNSMITSYMHVSNSLSMLSRKARPGSRPSRPKHERGSRPSRPKHERGSRPSRPKHNRGSRHPRAKHDPRMVLTVAADRTGNFTTITDAINFAPNNSIHRIIIHIKKGVYKENVEIPSSKQNIALFGDGREVTIISGSRSAATGWSTFRSATVGVYGKGFLARDITFENTAGPHGQAVALLINADSTAVYRCTITGYQDTLCVLSSRQFYRECDIYGTIDYIFGNAAAVFQGCNIVSRMPLLGQATVITAQSKGAPSENTGISIQNCTIRATDELRSKSNLVNNFLGRPWGNYSTTVVMKSYIDGFISSEGWMKWDGNQGLNTLYYGEYKNYGPGSSTNRRVSWPGHHLMSRTEASWFTVSKLLTGDQWLSSTSFPYNNGM